MPISRAARLKVAVWGYDVRTAALGPGAGIRSTLMTSGRSNPALRGTRLPAVTAEARIGLRR